MKFRLVLLLLLSTIAQYSFSQLNLPTKTIDDTEYYYRVVKEKETIYGISKELGISKETIFKHNPSVVALGLRKDQILYFPVSEFNGPAKSNNHPNAPRTHKVSKGENAYRISLNYGISLDALISANPGIVDGIKVGETLIIPEANTNNDNPAEKTDNSQVEIPQKDSIQKDGNQISTTAPIVPDSTLTQQTDSTNTVVAESEVVTDTVAEEPKLPVRITIMLPFKSEVEKRGKKIDLHTDFYRGFLMAANSYSDKDYEITINAVDTDQKEFNELETEILSQKADVIINCGDSFIHQTDSLGYANNIKVVNALNIKNKDYLQFNNVYQLNTPSLAMFETLNNAITKEYEGSKILYIYSNELKSKNIVNYFRENCSLAQKDIHISELMDDSFIEKELNSWDGHVIIIPTSSNKTFLKLIAPRLAEIREKTSSEKFTMFGYPEWQNDESMYDFYYNVGTCFHTRYSSLENEGEEEDLFKQYVYWFGKRPIESVPDLYIMGYDTAKFLIEAIANDSLSKEELNYEGTQVCFNLKKGEGNSGYYNTAVYLVNFKSDHTIEKVVIK